MKSAFQNWSDVRVFLAVLRSGSTLAASRQLGMAQPTVARRIEALEHTLGIILFERSTRGFEPTPAAAELVEAAERLEASADDLSEKAARLGATSSGVIRLTAPDSVFTSDFSAILEDFVDSYGDVRFEFLRRYDMVDLASGDADVAIRFSPGIDDPSLICRKVGEFGGSLAASRTYAAKHGVPTSEDELGGHKFVVYGGKYVPQMINDWLLERIDEDQVVMTCKDIETLASAIEMGAGIGPVPSPYVRMHENFVSCFDLPDETKNAAWLLVAPAAYRRKEVKAFTAFFAPRYSAFYRDD